MSEVVVGAQVWIWGRLVGAVVEMDDRRVVFEYDETFRRTGPELSPMRLPLTVAGPQEFPGLLRKDSFQGLPGLLADVLPDTFGRGVIRSYYTARGRTDLALSPVQQLLYVGNRGIGALEFRPAEEFPSRPAEEEALNIAALVADARRIIEGDARITIPEIYRIGSSAGGARPKAVVLYNQGTGEVRSGFAAPRDGDVAAILKFDGIGPDVREGEIGQPLPYNRTEAAYARMARDVGMDVVDVHILEGERGPAHLVIPRFDRPGARPLHQHTLGGLLHVDYNDVGSSSYEEYLRTILSLGMPHAAIQEAYLRAVFNVLVVNQDDHVKNFSFHRDESGPWRLTPAYDLTYMESGEWAGPGHQLRLQDKRVGIARKDLVELGRLFGIRAPQQTIERVQDVVAEWPTYAREAEVPSEYRERVANALERRRRSLDI